MRDHLCFLTAAFLVASPLTASHALAAPVAADPLEARARDEPILTLSQCLHEALTQPDALLQRNLEADEARQAIKSIKSATFSARATAQAQSTSNDRISTAGADGTIVSRERARAGLSISAPLYDGGRRKAHLGIAENHLKSVLESSRAEQLTTLQDTADAFYSVLSRQRLQEAGRLQLQAAQETLAAAQTRYDVGAVTRGDVLSAQSLVSQTEAEQQNRALDLDTARARLSLLIGRDPMLVAPVVVEPTAPPAPTDSVDALLTRLTASSPQRAVLLIKQDTAALEIRSVQAEHAPQVNLSGGGGYLAGRGSRLYATLGVELTAPLMDQAAFRARLREARDAQDLSAISLRQFDRAARERVLSATLGYSAARQKIAPSQAAVAAAAEAYRLAEGRYQAGKSAQQEVLQALLSLTQSRERLAAAQDEQNASAESLARLTGGEDPDTYLAAPASK